MAEESTGPMYRKLKFISVRIKIGRLQTFLIFKTNFNSPVYVRKVDIYRENKDGQNIKSQADY